MNNNSITWLASYPRSGNTFLRTILWQCFGLRSASIYPNDLAGNRQLEEYAGHIEHSGPNGQIKFPNNTIPLLKTHELPMDDSRAIYVIRDGRAVMISLWKFYNKTIPLEDFIEGRQKFSTWSSHVQAWAPFERTNTLLLEYEDMRTNLQSILEQISDFLTKDILQTSIPNRNEIANAEGRWVRKKSDWRAEFSDDLLARFNELNHDMLSKMGYL